MLAVGPITQVKVGSNYAQLSSPEATGGTGPYTYQWYKSFTNGFTPGSAYLIPGATSLAFTDTQLLPGVTEYYKIRATDTGNGNATADSAQSTVAVAAGSPVEMNQLVQTPIIGQVDLPQSPNTVSAVLDSGVVGTVLPGTAVKQIAPTGVTAGQGLNTLPHVTPCTSSSDPVWGFVQYNPKDTGYVAGDRMEVSRSGNVQWQVATANGTAGDTLQLDVTVAGGVQTVVGSSGATIVGQALDTPIIGMPLRVQFSANAPKQSA